MDLLFLRVRSPSGVKIMVVLIFFLFSGAANVPRFGTIGSLLFSFLFLLMPRLSGFVPR